jgi:peptidoglycan/LPS O-acetylase OafA/YrhL
MSAGILPRRRVAWCVSRLRNLLQRRTSSLAFIPQVDGLRFYAICAVLIFHCTAYLMAPEKNPSANEIASGWFAHLSRAGHSGVELFFVISGFILGLPFAKAARGVGKTVSLQRYFLRRIVRLEPPYILNLLILTMLLLLMGKASWNELWPHLVASLSYIHNIVYGQGSRLNFVAWTLEIEVQFYIVAPLLAQVFSLGDARLRRATLVAAIVVASFASHQLSSSAIAPQAVRLSLAVFLQYFLAGFLLADWYADGGEQRTNTTLADALAMPCVVGAFALEEFPAIRGYVLPWVFAGLCISAMKGCVHSRLASSPAPVLIGGMCYTLYLYHPVIKAAMGPWIVAATPRGCPVSFALAGQLAVFSVVIIATCIPLFLALERPFMGIDAIRRGRR